MELGCGYFQVCIGSGDKAMNLAMIFEQCFVCLVFQSLEKKKKMPTSVKYGLLGLSTVNFTRIFL